MPKRPTAGPGVTRFSRRDREHYKKTNNECAMKNCLSTKSVYRAAKHAISLLIMLSLVSCGSSENHGVRSVEDAKHARLGVVTGTTPSQLAHERFPEADIMEFGAFTDVLGALSAGHIDATISGINGAILAARNNDELAVIEGSLRDESTSVAVQKGNDQLLADVNRLINEMKTDGTLDDLDRRWLKREPGPYETKDIPLPSEGEVLRVGVSASNEPVAFVDKRRGLTGRDVEIAHEIASRLGRPLEFFDVRWDGLIPALQSGRIDLIISGMTGNTERAQYVDFSESYYQNKLVLLVRKSAASEALPYQDLEFEDLKSAPIAVVVGTAHDNYAQKNFPDAELLQFNTFADQLLAVEQRRVASGLTDEDPIKVAIDEGHPLKTVGPSIFAAEYGAGFNKDSSALRDQFNEFLAELVASGDYDGIVDRWVTTGTGPMPDIQFSGDEPPLKIGNSVYGLPSVAVQNGELVGFDVEIAVRFAQYIGKRPVWATSDWGALIPSLVSGKIDLVISSMTITEERAERIDFSDSYYSTGNYFFVVDDEANSQADIAAGSAGELPFQNLSFDELKQSPIGVVVGTAHDTFAQKHYPDAELLQFNVIADQLLAVEQRRVASGLADEDTLNVIIAEGRPLKMVGESLFSADSGAGFRKESDELREQFNAFLADLKASGDYEDVVDRWIRVGDGPLPNITFTGDEEPLVIGNSVFGLPSVAIKNGELVGFDVELGILFAKYIGKRPDWVTMDWGGIIPSLMSGKIDVIISSMFITEERAERINFSDPYYSTGNYFFVLDETKVVGNAASGAESGGTFVDDLKDSFYSNIIKEDRYLLLWDGLKITILLSLLSGIFGTAVGGVVCFMRMSPFALLNVPAKIFISILRGTPVLVLLMIIFYVIFAKSNISPVLVAIIAFGLNFGAYASEIFRSGIQSIDRGQTEAGISMGFSKARTFIYVIMPQTIQRILPVYKGEFISMIKMTSIVGYVAVQDLTKASDIIRARTFDAFFPLVMIAILYFLIAWLFLKILDYVEHQTDPLRRREGGRS